VFDAFVTGNPRLTASGSTTFAMQDDLAVFLSILLDGPTMQLCGFSLVVVAGPKANRAVFLTVCANVKTRIGASPVSMAVAENELSVSFAKMPSGSTDVAELLIRILFAIFDRIASHNSTNSRKEQLSARLFLADSFEASVLKSILWAVASGSEEEKDITALMQGLSIEGKPVSKSTTCAALLLATFFADSGPLINAPLIPDIQKYNGSFLTIVQKEADKLVSLRLFRHKLGIADYSRALKVDTASGPIGTLEILEHWTGGNGSDEANRGMEGALLETARTIQHIVLAIRSLLNGSPQINRIPTHSRPFAWSDLFPDEVSIIRKQAAFSTLHELFLVAEKRCNTRARYPLAVQLELGAYFFVEVDAPTPTPVRERGTPQRPVNPEPPLPSPAPPMTPGSTPSTPVHPVNPKAAMGSPTSPSKSSSKATFRALGRPITQAIDGEQYWWLIPRDPSGANDAQIEKQLTDLTEFRGLFTKACWFPPAGWARVTVDSIPTEGCPGVLSTFVKFAHGATATFVLLPNTFDVNTPALVRCLLSDPSATPSDVELEEILSDSATRWACEPFDEFAQRVSVEATTLLENRIGPAAELTPSQADAIKRSLTSHLSLIWGPPGTGKTRALSALILLLCVAHKRISEPLRPLRILVISLTNSNIRHALRTICSLRDRCATDITVTRLDAATKKAEDITTGKMSTPLKLLRENPVVVIGTTVWQARSAFKEMPNSFDVVVWDDASQSKAGELAIPHVLLRRSSGRLVIAGDPLQLPPITSGAFTVALPIISGLPAIAACQESMPPPPISQSLFECVAAGNPTRSLVSVLSENWRMNSGLCGFLASTLYSAESCGAIRPYAPATADIANAKIQLPAIADDTPLSSLERFVLAPDKPLVVVIVQSGTASAINECPEAPIVAGIVSKFHSLLPGDDESFWLDSILLLAPHHYQRAALLGQLAALEIAGKRVVVETVERAQGQERDIAILDYAIFSKHRIETEAKFLYSVNRLNVGISRARVKCIVFLSDAMLSSLTSDVLFEHKSAQEGFKFLHSLVSHARSHNSVFELTIP
jgi:hypothetical protein